MLEMKPTSNLWVPSNPMGTCLAKISNSSWVHIFNGYIFFSRVQSLGWQNPTDLYQLSSLV
jgi:hypothetical protein